jgi:GNAT superfamily N-acetyltransferase
VSSRLHLSSKLQGGSDKTGTGWNCRAADCNTLAAVRGTTPLRELSQAAFVAELDALTAVYQAAMMPDPAQLPGRRSIMERHASYDGFRALAVTEDTLLNFEQPGFEQPGFGPPGFEPPGFERPDREQPGRLEQPGLGPPGPDRPGPDRPGPDRPSRGQPGRGQPGGDREAAGGWRRFGGWGRPSGRSPSAAPSSVDTAAPGQIGMADRSGAGVPRPAYPPWLAGPSSQDGPGVPWPADPPRLAGTPEPGATPRPGTTPGPGTTSRPGTTSGPATAPWPGTTPGRIIGFSYGFRGADGQWWHDVVVAALTARSGAELARAWLANSLEIAEVHVHPDYHRRGIGRSLVLGLAAGRVERTAVLSTQDANATARRLYSRLGFGDLMTGYSFPGSAVPYAVMGAVLPLRVAPAPTPPRPSNS